MKFFLGFLVWISTITSVSGQEGWKIHHNGRLKLSANQEADSNKFSLKKADLKKTGSLMILVKEQKKQKDWIRTILIVDDKDNEVLRHAGDLFKIGNSKLNSLSKKSTGFSIYSVSLPADPKKAALVRVRRIHLASFNII